MIDQNLAYFLIGIAGLTVIGGWCVKASREAGKDKIKKHLVELAAGCYGVLWFGVLGCVHGFIYQWHTGQVPPDILVDLLAVIVGAGGRIIWKILKAYHTAIAKLAAGNSTAHDNTIADA
jgi:hypothetical protein